MREWVFFVLVLLLLLLPFGAAFPFDARTGDDLTVGSGEVVDGDLFLAGETVVIDGTVRGDLYAVAQTVHIRGEIRDSATIAAGTITITGSVGQGMHAAAQELRIQGSIDGDVLAAARIIALDGGGSIDGDLISLGQRIVLGGSVSGYVLGAGSTVSMGGTVGGDSTLIVRILSLQDGARIGGDLRYISEREAVIFPGAEVVGRTVRRLPEYRDWMRTIFPFIIIAGIVGKILSFVMMVIVGLVFLLLAPSFFYGLSESIKRYPGHCAGWGALLLFGVPIGVFLAFMTLLGITLAVMASLAYGIALYLSQIVAALLIGRLLLGIRERPAQSGRLFGCFVLGLFLLRLVRFIPGIGVFVWIAAEIFGLGALLVTLAKRRKTLQA
jgi:cytoskeletal protein CcmA (bactofilin family)